MANKTSTLLAQWLGRPGGLPRVVSSSPNPSNFFFMHIKTCTCTFNVCTLYVHCTNLSVHGTDMFIILNLCTWFTLVHLGSPVSVHCLYTVCKFSVLNNLYIHVCKLYVHCTYLSVHGTDMFYWTEPASHNAIAQEFAI